MDRVNRNLLECNPAGRRRASPDGLHRRAYANGLGSSARLASMTPRNRSRRSFLRASAALAGAAPLMGGRLWGQKDGGPLFAYVGTFSSPLRDVLPTQVDLPPGNGRGIHLFHVNRTTGAMTPAGIHEMGTSPSCLALNTSRTRLYSANETDRVGEHKHGTVSAFAINQAD